MASKRAVQYLSFRTSSSLLRSQCTAAPRRTFSVALPARVSQYRPQFTAFQQRWYSTPESQKSKIYGFEDVKQLISQTSSSSNDSAPLLIDVREPSEFEADSIPTAVNIPIASQPDSLLLPAEEFEDRFGFAKPDVGRHVVFFCKAGVRSRAAAQIAKQGGYVSVGEYPGSWLDWERNGGTGSKTG